MAHNGGLVRIREAMPSIKRAERNAARYILEHPEKVITMSVKQLADASGSSQAAIIRMCKGIGLEGFQELKVRIAGDLQMRDQSNTITYQEIRADDGAEVLMRNISENNIFSIKETLHILDEQAISKAIQALHRAERIEFYGAAASQLIAQDAQQKFIRINKPCTAYQDMHMQITSSVTLTSEDVAFAISYSGETRHILHAIQNAKKRGATTIALTRYGSNSLSDLVDIPLYTSSSEAEIRSSASSSRIAQLNVIDILFTGVAAINYDESVDYLNETREALRKEFRE
ncbi:sialic acid utilization regulator, RpiR family [Geomicrobium sp. JCM 19037]|uniref:MurR/RpiR family transcriptional regulator n=1 Tax=unclassified Geomicrobium TaxID=2628951 RepID=UPI00045F18D7|nr:MurR/RpiR family transcriptional regulator [Geomicrobium sp. JCM 19037]GAK03767.1 sialic acid utilization regulator, RpiR family [Geomicrobium sp. JCM 19037]